jgi:UDP-glucose 4-epimerase
MGERTAVVTGGAGFIGSHLVDRLLGDGRKVVVVDNLSTGSSERVASEASLEEVDVSNRRELDRVVDVARPGAIFHVAAQSSVTVSVTHPERDCRDNVVGTLHVVEAAKRHRAAVVFTSTGGALYGNDAPLPTGEDALPAPISPYGASKWAGEAYVLTWGRSSGLANSVMRLGNVYGPRQSPHGEAGVVAIFSYLLWGGKAPTVYGNGHPTRDYVHVRDVVDALVSAEGTPGVFNVSTGRETDVLTILDALQRVAGTDIAPMLQPLREGELERSCMSPERAERELGWRAETELSAGLAETYEALVEAFATTADHRAD